MDRNGVARQCMDLVDNNFFFLEDARKKWDIKKNEMLSDVSLAESDEEALVIIDRCLVSLHDPHTRLLFKEKPKLVLPHGFLSIHKKLYLEWEGDLKEVISINHVDVHGILDRYLGMYESFPLVLVENEMVKDLQFLNRCFAGDNLQISYLDDTEHKVCLYPIAVEKWMESLKLNANGFQIDSVYIRRVDQESICIQIITFRDKEVVSKIVDGLRQIKGSYKTIIFDVRNNTGGYIDTAKELVSKLISRKIRLDYEIVKMDGETIQFETVEIMADALSGFVDKQIIVFVNYRTMSSAEYIFTKALQLQGVLIVGEETAGLKDQASVIPVEDTVAIQVTTKRYIKEGIFLQQGIIPDIFIESGVAESRGQDAYFEWYQKYKGDFMAKG
ncbi:MAG: hypothetical protein K1W41_24735 [Lachnospiraceae bacterium]